MVYVYTYSFSFSAFCLPADKRVKPPVTKPVKVCTDETAATLQECFECTYWQMFQDAATQDSNISLEENE